MAIKIDLYASEQAARDAYLRQLLSFCGIDEGGDNHKRIVAMYNMIQPLPRNHTATAKDSWCAIFLCAVAWAMGFRDWPWECSCSRIMTEAKVRGIWHNGWTDGARLGQWCIYDLDKSGAVDHIGAVIHISGDEVWIVEGNYGNAVKIRRIKVGDARVVGFVDLPYEELVEEPAAPDAALMVDKLIAAIGNATRYDRLEDVPEYGRATIAKLMDKGLLQGREPDQLDLSDDMVRVLTVLDRAQMFDN